MRIDTKETFGGNLKQLMDKRHVSVSDLATELNVTEDAVRKWRSGKTTPTRARLRRVAEFLKVSLDSLFSDAPVTQQASVSRDRDEDMDRYERLLTFMESEVKRLQAEVNRLSSRVVELDEENRRLRSRGDARPGERTGT